MSDDGFTGNRGLPRKVKVVGTVFLLFQILFAVNNYGPQNVPGLSLFFGERWIGSTDAFAYTPTGQEHDPIKLADVTAASGLLSFRRARVNSSRPSYLEVMGGGLAVADVDSDGYEDVFLISMPSFRQGEDEAVSPSSLYRNRGDGTFEDITEEAGLAHIAGYPQGALFFDFDNDGWQDLYVASYGGGQLFRNEEGTFVDVTDSAGLSLEGLCGVHPCFSSAAATADYNRNGHLDLFIVNNVDWDIHDPAHYGERRLFPAFFEAQRSILFKNNGDGTFSNVTAESGVTNEGGKGLSAVWLDFNNNGWPDLYVANDLTRNRLYLNNQDGTFTEFGAGAQVNEVKSSMGVNASDYDHSGHLDLVTTNLEGSRISLFRNRGDLRFDYATGHAGLNPSARSTGWGIEFVDLNFNGHPDLIKAAGPVWALNPGDAENLVFRNDGEGRFIDVTNAVGRFSNSAVSRGLVIIDVLNNGKPDLIVNNIDGGTPQLLMNITETDHGWIKLTFEGTMSNRDAIGARVELQRTDGLRIVQEVRAGSSYQSTSTKALFFGLADAGVERLTVRWPSGITETVRDVPLNTTLHLREQEAALLASQHDRSF
jgi:enediyne biosynthesis protein E4